MFTLLKLITDGVIDDEFILYCERIIINNYAIKKTMRKALSIIIYYL